MEEDTSYKDYLARQRYAQASDKNNPTKELLEYISNSSMYYLGLESFGCNLPDVIDRMEKVVKRYNITVSDLIDIFAEE